MPARLHDVKITSPTGIGQTTDVLIDGHASYMVSAAVLRLNARDVNELTLTLAMPVVEFDGKAAVRLDDSTTELLARLGWRAPADEDEAVEA